MAVDKLQKWELVFSNIKMNKDEIPNPHNYYYFDNFENFVEILQFTWFFAVELSKHNEFLLSEWKKTLWRNERPSFNIFFDELWIFANSMDYKQLHKEHWDNLYELILQCRKLFDSIYLIAQKPKLIANSLRQHISYWYTMKPLWGWKWLWKYSSQIWVQDLDPETYQVEIKKEIKFDKEWNKYTLEIPMEVVERNVWFRKKYFRYYDDLYLNKRFDFELVFPYLEESWFFYNLKAWRVQNKYLLEQKNIYGKVIEHINVPDTHNLTLIEFMKELIDDCIDWTIYFFLTYHYRFGSISTYSDKVARAK